MCIAVGHSTIQGNWDNNRQKTVLSPCIWFKHSQQCWRRHLGKVLWSIPLQRWLLQLQRATSKSLTFCEYFRLPFFRQFYEMGELSSWWCFSFVGKTTNHLFLKQRNKFGSYVLPFRPFRKFTSCWFGKRRYQGKTASSLRAFFNSR